MDTTTQLPTSSQPTSIPTFPYQPTQVPTTSHPIQVPMTSHSTQVPMTSYPIQVPTTSHPIQVPITSHSIQVPTTSHSIQVPTTSHSIQVPMTSHSIQVPTTSHPIQVPIHSHPIQSQTSPHSTQSTTFNSASLLSQQFAYPFNNSSSTLNHTTSSFVDANSNNNMCSLVHNNQTVQTLFESTINPEVRSLSAIPPALRSENHGNTSQIQNNFIFLDKIGRRFFTIDPILIESLYPAHKTKNKMDLLVEKFRKNSLDFKGVENKDMPHGGQCMKDDCLSILGASDGEHCKNEHCIKYKLLNLPTILYHEECLIRFNGGDSAYCCWCIILFSLTNCVINEREYFCNVGYPNAPWKVKGYFKVPNIQHTLKSISEKKTFDDIVNECVSWNHFCLLSAVMPSGKVAYYLVSYQFQSEIATPFREIVSKYQYSFGKGRDDQQELKDRSKDIIFPVLRYPFTEVCDSRPNEYDIKTIEVIWKVPKYDESIETGVLQINNLYFKSLATKNGRMSIDELLDYNKPKKKQRIHKKYYTQPHENKWSNAKGSFGILFNGWNYKSNKSEIQIAQKENKKKNKNRKKGEKKSCKLPHKMAEMYDVQQCSNTFDLPKYHDLRDRNNHFIRYNLNRFIQTMAKEIPELSHWKTVHLFWDKMTERLQYRTKPGRHTDNSTLFNPKLNDQSSNDILNYPVNGQAALMHNYVNAHIDRNGEIQRVANDTTPKYFCLDQKIEYHWKCKDGPKNNAHFKIFDNQFAILLFSQRAAYMKPHKPEKTDKGWNSVFMTRNYLGLRDPAKDKALKRDLLKRHQDVEQDAMDVEQAADDEDDDDEEEDYDPDDDMQDPLSMMEDLD